MTGDTTTTRLNQIIHADCLQELAFLRDESIDLTLFSPPYDGIRDYKKNWSFDFSMLGRQLYRVTKDGGVAIVVIGDGTKQFAKSLTSFRLAVNWVDEVGWKLFECVIYHRDGNPGAWWTQRFRVDHEYVLIFFKGERPKTFQKDHLMIPSKHAGKIYSGTDRLTNGGFKRITPKAVNPMKCRGTVWQYATSNTEGNRLKLLHPATFPDKLAEDLILCFSQPGDIVLDPMCGSGTTCVVARNNNRKYIGIEISQEYCEIARKRIEKEFQNVEQRTMFQEDSL
ncbi:MULTISPECIES: site-specific DNA-methyltransferase [Roseiflexus]|uniref:Methyltransferase n=1 Tax=Roseiflexus castenholzii (strain DSM 13941 / HLO8) TaxID=383372 RepID=A7NHP4_ROSCS|nr:MULTISPECIES: site-specific DNA-methyltransferase [Roseiflexus]ABU56991.1 DNA methylase N-4/N-6 domain protein [Roseiflexus castenholzii DSM 13941]GIV99798.1 MAG: methyltransferase [Roseiflexus sp.]